MSVSWQSDEVRPVDWRYWLAAALCAIPAFALLAVLFQIAVRVAVWAGGVTL